MPLPAPTYAMSVPGSIEAGRPAPVTLKPSGPIASDTVTFSDGGGGGTFAPTSLAWSGSSAPGVVGYTNPTAGTYTITASSSNDIPIAGNPASLAVVAATASFRRPRWFPGLARPHAKR